MQVINKDTWEKLTVGFKELKALSRQHELNKYGESAELTKDYILSVYTSWATEMNSGYSASPELSP